MKFLNKYLMFIIGLIVVLNIGPGYLRADSGGALQKTFEVSPGGLLVLNTDRGNIEVKGATQNAVTVKIIYKMKSLHIEFEQRGKDIYVTGRYEAGILERIRSHLFHDERQTRFVVTVPIRYNMDLKTSGGQISIDDLEGDIKSRTSGGSLYFTRVRGKVSGSTSGGKIEIWECIGPANVETSGGGIRVNKMNGDVNAHTSGGSITLESVTGKVAAETSGGSIDARRIMGAIDAKTRGGGIQAQLFEQPGRDCHLTTSGGNVTVGLANSIAVDIDAETRGGEVAADFPVSAQGVLKRSALKGKINGGGPLLYLRTSGGNIRIEKK